MKEFYIELKKTTKEYTTVRIMAEDEADALSMVMEQAETFEYGDKRVYYNHGDVTPNANN